MEASEGSFSAVRCAQTFAGSETCGNYTGLVLTNLRDASSKRSRRGPDGYRPPTDRIAVQAEYSPWIGNTFWRDTYTPTGAYGGNTTQDGSCLELLATNDLAYLPNQFLNPYHIALSKVCEARAIERAYDSVRNLKVDAAVYLAEIGKSSEMLVRNSRAIANSIRYARRGLWQHAWRELHQIPPKRMPKGVAGRYLELTFGWLPFISESLAIYNAIDEGFEKIKITGRGRYSEEGVRTSTFGMPKPNFFNGAGSITTKFASSAYCRLDYSLTNDNLRRLTSIGFVNPASFVYELTFLSWMVDYFSTLGGIVRSLDAGFGLAFRGGSVTSRSTVQKDGTATVGPYSGRSLADHTYERYGSARFSYSGKRIERVPFATAPAVPFVVQLPRNLKQYANSLAYIVVALSNSKR